MTHTDSPSQNPSQRIHRRSLFSVVLLLLLAAGDATAQNTTSSTTDSTTPAGLAAGAPAGSYELSGFENLNLYNGNLNFLMPLLHIGGRGSAGYTMMFSLNLKGWRTKDFPHTDPQGNPVDVFNPTTQTWGFLSAGYGPGVLQGRQSGTQASICPGNSLMSWFKYTVTRLTFTAADGTEHELRDQATYGQPMLENNSQCSTSVQGASRGAVFTTVDGSNMIFVSDTTIYDRIVFPQNNTSVLTPSGYLRMRDGTTYRLDNGLVSWIRDHNGNKITFAYDGYNRVTMIKDAINRQITINYNVYDPNYGYHDQIIFNGFNGTQRIIRVVGSNLASALRNTQPGDLTSVQTYHALFPEMPNASNASTHNPSVVSSLWLPDGQRRYQFFYNVYGELARVVLPTGGAIEYDSTASSGVGTGVLNDGNTSYEIFRRVVERRTYPDGITREGKTKYLGSGGGVTDPLNLVGISKSNVIVDHFAADGTTRLAREWHYYYGSPDDSLFEMPDWILYDDWKNSREYETDEMATDGATILRKTVTTWQPRSIPSWATLQAGFGTTANDPREIETDSTLAEVSPNLVTKQTFSYSNDAFNNRTDVYEYDYGSNSSGSLIRHTQSTYQTASTYTNTNLNLISLPTQMSIYDAGGTERARATYEYDNYATDGNHAGLTDRPGISNFDSSFGASYATRGNATATTSYLLINGSVTGSVSTYMQYDIAGNAVKSIDGRGYATNFYYADCFGTPNGEALTNSAPSELGSLSSYAFVTSVTNAQLQTAYSQYDYYTGRPVDAKDANGVIASGYYNDTLDRPTQIRRAVGTSAENQTTFSYDDIGRVITSTSDLNSNNDYGLVSKVLYDGFGRTTETRQYEGGSKYITTQQQYDAMGRGYKTSNPFRPLPPDNQTPVWTTTAFDALSRSISVTTPDSAVVGTAFSGNQVLVTDQIGKQRLSKTNAIGQLKDVWEVTSPDSATEAISFPGHAEVTAGYHTSYAYDVLDDLTTVAQGVQTRAFAYDSLKRLTSATNPESGTVTYQYDNNGNLTQKTDARIPAVTTTYTWDALNRPQSRTYSDGTPRIDYRYDNVSMPPGAPTFDRGYSTGRLVAVTYGGINSSAGTYRGYDAMGRVLRQYQQTDSVNYLVEASYYANSAIHDETYPSIPGYGDRRVVSYVNDPAGRLGSLSTAATSYAPGASVSSIGYWPHNGLTTETYGNSLVNAVTYNNRLQPNEIKLGTSGAPTSVVDLIYNYGTTNNNGNVQTITYNGGGLGYTQSFGYDQLNRLTTSQENSGANWSQTNSYDRYGNRSIVGGGLSFDANNNRIIGYSFDAAGNLFNDGYHAYTYDAENKISKVDGNSAYVYDGEGQRVRKLLSENLRFIYDMGGKQIAEFDGVNGTLKKEYIYGASGLVATIEPTSVNANGARYSTADNLGTPRVITNSSASVVSRHDYKPFGEELGSGIGGRTTGMGYSVADGLRQKFTRKERDNETGLDYFLARYYSSTQGRFTSPDEFTGGPDELYSFAEDASANPTFYADLRKPQSLNKYQYAYNNPLRWTDPDGHDPDEPDPEPQGQTKSNTIPVPTLTPISIPEAQQLIEALKRANAAVDDALYPISQLIGTAPAGTIDPIVTAPSVPMPLPTTGTPPSQSSQPVPPPPPVQARVNKVAPDPGASGPHSVAKRDPRTGKVTGYTEYDKNGNPVKRYRGQGKPHGGVKPPFVVEPKKPGGRPHRARPARPDEIPQ